MSSTRPASPSSRSQGAERPAGLRPLRALALLAPLLLPGSASAQVRFEVSGQARPAGEGLLVRVDLENAGDVSALEVRARAELQGRPAEAGPFSVGPREARGIVLDFPARPARPGLHVLTLLLEFREGSPSGPQMHQRVFLSLGIGAETSPAVRVAPEGLRLDTLGELRVGLESADGEPHRVRLTVLPTRGLNRLDPDPVVPVPARGRALAAVRLIRAGAQRGSRQGAVVIASAIDGELERAAAATALVEVLPDPALLPRLRPWLAVGALLLIASSALLELRDHLRRRA